MIDAVIQNELLKEVAQLSPPLQQKVIDFAQSLKYSMPHGTPGDQLLPFAGILSAEEARNMIDSIEEDCERIDPNEW
jgi:hypothetical protein